MQYRKLGSTGLSVSVICQGCWAIIPQDGFWGGNEHQDSIDAIRASLDAGVNFFDTAEAYGRGSSEAILGEALDGVPRDDVVVATKASGKSLTPAGLKAACERSLQHLKMDYIDLYQIHWPSRDVPLADTWGAMQELVDEGKIRYGGVSNFGVSYLQGFDAIGGVAVSNQLCYNLLFRAIEYEVLPESRSRSLSILAYSPIAQGLLTGKFACVEEVPAGRARTRLFSQERHDARHGEPGNEEAVFRTLATIRGICEELGKPMGHVAIAWVLAQQGIASALVGSRNAQQSVENAKAAQVVLDDATVGALSAATAELKAAVGKNADMWQGDSRLEKPAPQL